jgi:hypothetical protein
MRVIFFNDEDTKAYAKAMNFINIVDFRDEIQDQLGYKVKLSNAKFKACIMTNKCIPAGIMIPLDETDVEICNCYTADIEKVEGK